MKQPFLFILIFVTYNVAFSQQNASQSPLIKQEYLKRSKKEKTIAWILLGQGILFVSLGLVHSNLVVNDTEEPNRRDLYIVAGVVSMAGSAVLFIGSSKDRRQVLSLQFKHETLPQFYKTSLVSRTIPSLELKINL